MCSNDFHNELYGRIQRHIEDATDRFAKEDEVDAYLENEGIPKTKTWSNGSRCYQTTLPVYVRNTIHHPENTANASVTNDELRESIEHLIAAVEKINKISNPPS